MDKNTILAIALSTVVVIASISLQAHFTKKNAPSDEVSSIETSETNKAIEAGNATNFDEAGKLDNSLEKKGEGLSALGSGDASISSEGGKGDKSNKGGEAGEVKGAKDGSTSLGEILNEEVDEEVVTIDTVVAQITLTNRGGDVTGYKLDKNEHRDVDTGDGVQMVTHTTDTNRAFGVALGGAASNAINELFALKQEHEGGRHTLLFTRNFPGFIFGKRYTFIDGEYMFKLELLFKKTNNIKSDKSDGGIPIEYTLRSAPQIGPQFNPKINKYEVRQFISNNGEKAKKINISSSKQYKEYQKNYIWQGIAGKYFIEVVIPSAADAMAYTHYSTAVFQGNEANAQMFMTRKSFSLDDSLDNIDDIYHIYFGPRNEKCLKVYNTKTTNAFELEGQKLNLALQSSGWLGWLETILKWMLEIINRFARNWGVSIIVLTLVIKLLLFPLTKKQSMSTLKVQDLQPKIKALQERYKQDPQKLQEALAKLYKDAGYNPASGCLPLILQFLILFAMYNLFNNYFEFRGKGFIQGWIDDLTMGDSVYTFAADIPFFGNQLRILPIIYLISQLLFGKITGNGGTAAPGTSKMQMNLMMYGMPIMFFFLFYNAPSGLLLYWTVSNIFQMVQQIIINRALKAARAKKDTLPEKTRKK